MKLFNKYKFSDKSQTLGGMISTVMGLAALVSFGYGIYIAFQAKGNAGLEVGSLGLLSFMLSVIGLVIGLLSFKEEDKFYTFSRSRFPDVWYFCNIYGSSADDGHSVNSEDL